MVFLTGSHVGQRNCMVQKDFRDGSERRKAVISRHGGAESVAFSVSVVSKIDLDRRSGRRKPSQSAQSRFWQNSLFSHQETGKIVTRPQGGGSGIRINMKNNRYIYIYVCIYAYICQTIARRQGGCKGHLGKPNNTMNCAR